MDDDQPSFTRIIQPVSPEAPPLSVPAGAHPTLVWRPKLGGEQAFPLENRTATIGRHDDNDIVLAGPTVSARHAILRCEPVGVVLEDEGSLNGTFVNGQLIQQHLLEAGDQIQVGPHLLVFVPPAGGAPTAS
jgi:pSer/pThr/pTyr-binding forkhead associated (FHA) protein